MAQRLAPRCLEKGVARRRYALDALHPAIGADQHLDHDIALAIRATLGRRIGGLERGGVARIGLRRDQRRERSEEHTYEPQSLMRSSYAVFCLKTKKTKKK